MYSSGGVRGAAFVHSPLLQAKGRLSMDLMHVTDWVPTLYGLGGGESSELRNLDGYDMWPTLSSGKASPRVELLHNIDPATWTAALRHKQWKLVVNECKDPFCCIYCLYSSCMIVRSWDLQRLHIYVHRIKPLIWALNSFIPLFVRAEVVNPLRPNNDLSQSSHCDIKGLSVSEVLRIENMITQMKFY